MTPRRWLLVCFGLVLVVKLFLAFQSPGLALDDSYFHVRQASQIMSTGTPLFESETQSFLFSPVFAYILSPFVGGLGAQIIASLFLLSTMVVVFFLALELTKSEFASAIASAVSAFVPALWSFTDSIVPAMLAIPLLFLMVYLFIKEQKNSVAFVSCLIFFVLLSPLSIVFAFTLICYLLFVYLESLKQRNSEIELSVFTIFFVLLSLFFLFRRSIAQHGTFALIGNVPTQLLVQDVSLGVIVFGIGFVPFLAGLWVVSQFLFIQKNRVVYMLTSLVLVTALLSVFNLVDVSVALAICGTVFATLSGQAIVWLREFLESTKWAKRTTLAWSILCGLIILTSVIGSITAGVVASSNSVSSVDLEAYDWIKQNTPREALVVTPISEGFAMEYLSSRSSLQNNHFLLRDANERFTDNNRLLSSGLQIAAIELLDKYNASYIFFSRTAMEETGISVPRYASSEECFPLVFDNNVTKILMRNPDCEVRVIET